MSVLYNGSAIIQPDLLLGWESTREARTVVHPVIGRPDPDVTIRPAALRTGTLSLFFLDLAAAQAAESSLSQPGVWEVHHVDPGEGPELDGIVVSGPLVIRADGPNLDRWIVELGYTDLGYVPWGGGS